VIRMCTFRRIT